MQELVAEAESLYDDGAYKRTLAVVGRMAGESLKSLTGGVCEDSRDPWCFHLMEEDNAVEEGRHWYLRFLTFDSRRDKPRPNAKTELLLAIHLLLESQSRLD